MTPTKPITVLLADDHAIVRRGLCALLNADAHFTIVGESRNGREAVAMARALRPDVILMDIAMPVLNGLEATRQILAANPAAKVIILSAHSDDEYIERTRGLGVFGFLEKQTSAEFLTKAVRAVANGRTCFSPGIARRLTRGQGKSRHLFGVLPIPDTKLTSRKSAVPHPGAAASAKKQVAAEPRRGGKTVGKHRPSLMERLKVRTKVSLARCAPGTGFVEGGVRLTIV